MYFDVDGKPNKPCWVRLNVQELVDFFEIEDISDIEYLEEENPKIFENMGILLFNMMLYAKDRDSELIDISDREMKALFRILKKGIDISYVRYETNVANGKKGGRPKEENQE